MVYETKTYRLQHELTEVGQENYQKLLVSIADEILYRHKHPIKWFINKIFPRIFKCEKDKFEI